MSFQTVSSNNYACCKLYQYSTLYTRVYTLHSIFVYFRLVILWGNQSDIQTV